MADIIIPSAVVVTPAVGIPAAGVLCAPTIQTGADGITRYRDQEGVVLAISPTNCAAVIACILAAPVGAAAVPGTTSVLGLDGQWHLLPAFATPAETIAGTSTTTIINPAGLTAKLANQPAADACTDREDVVWNGTILQGAAKHYSIPRTTLSLSTPPGVLDGTFADSTNITVVNPSSCRAMRLTFENISGYFYTPMISACNGNLTYRVPTTFGAGMYGFTSLVSPGVDHYYATANKGYFLSLGGYIDIPPGASCAVQFEVSNPMLTPGTTHPYQEHFASVAFTGQTI